jgi:hypothetical protein
MSFHLPRRRFQFRLRTLLIVVTLLAVVCAYVTHEAAIVRKREAWLETHFESFKGKSHMFKIIVQADRNRVPSGLRKWLGDYDLQSWVLSRQDTRETAIEISALFPEATIYWDEREHLSED